MRAITLGAEGLRMVRRPAPQITADDEVKVRTIAVGVCGTDRALVSRRDAAPRAEIVIGHELLGEVTETGAAVKRVQPGDLAVFTVRRSCRHCASCAQNRSDMCSTGHFSERGIRGLDGFQAEFWWTASAMW